MAPPEKTKSSQKDLFYANVKCAYSSSALHGDYISAMTECVTDYINFCVESIVPTRTIRHFPNKKPWITSDLEKLMNMKKSVQGVL